jgi:spore maturation protein CgeB
MGIYSTSGIPGLGFIRCSDAMRFLFGFSYYKSPGKDVKLGVEGRLARLRRAGINVDSFVLTLDPPGHQLYWPELDLRWRRGERKLLAMYENLGRILESYDVFINWNGINIHPEFVLQLPTFNVFGCFDDPEASELLSKPVAWSYDLAMVGNIAELDSYKSWGVKNVRHWPLGFFADDYDPSLTRERIWNEVREIDIALLCERETNYRRERLDRFIEAFPHGAYYGRGWPGGYLPEDEKVRLYQRTKIGPNFHNSTGPVNFRTFILPANGVMQVCDNKSDLGKLFELGKEVVGFDTVDEAIEICRYYLEHDEERRQIAAAGWERAVKDFNEVSTFRLVEKYVEELLPTKEIPPYHSVQLYLRRHRWRALLKTVLYALKSLLGRMLVIPKRLSGPFRNLKSSTRFSPREEK